MTTLVQTIALEIGADPDGTPEEITAALRAASPDRVLAALQAALVALVTVAMTPSKPAKKSAGASSSRLSDREQKMCAEMKISPAAYARKKAARKARGGGR